MNKYTRTRAFNAGFTLIELLIYMVLAVIVLLIVGGLLINSLATERTVSDATQASNSGQLVSRSVGQGVRNASAIWTSPLNAIPELLIVRTAGSGAEQTWRCQAWSYKDGQVRTTTSAGIIPTAAGDIATWTLLGDGMAPVSGSPVFRKNPLNGRRVDLGLDVSTGPGKKPVRISTSSTSRQPLPASGPDVSLPCF
ncbi:PilW family protein [Cryobacterium shii]|uniref:PilW family protein n=1 Tax=Cryobacterium shii TaxID=1259235 RepID=UPI00135CAB88|nr:prepilin-type N-terminal cleavage/methylation domain-containing protein [Cryobacterium shii]